MTTRKISNSNDESPTSRDESTALQRLQRVMAAAGVAARRECELIIQEGRVEVDGKVVSTLGMKVDPTKQKIFVDGQRLSPEKRQYFMLNKPPGVISTSNDPSGRARVIDMIKTDLRVYNVGRLDQSSEGLILVTNDGELANRLTHPRYGIEKKYHVQVDGVPTPEQLRSLVEGIYIDEGKAKATSAKILKKTEHKSWLEVVLSEGKNREIRRILAKIGHKVRVLKRVAIGPLKMGDLPVGAHRQLTFQELKDLKRAAEGLAQKGKERRAPMARKKKFPPRGPRTQSKHPTNGSRDSMFRSKGESRKPKTGTVLDFESKSKSDKHRFKRPAPSLNQTSPSQFRQRPVGPSRKSDDDAVSSKVEKFIPFDKVHADRAQPNESRTGKGASDFARPARSKRQQTENRSVDGRAARGTDSRRDGHNEARHSGRPGRRPEGWKQEPFAADGGPRSESRIDRRSNGESRGSQSQARSARKTMGKKPSGQKSFGGKQVSQIRGSEPVQSRFKSKGQRPGDRSRSGSRRKGNSAKGRQR